MSSAVLFQSFKSASLGTTGFWDGAVIGLGYLQGVMIHFFFKRIKNLNLILGSLLILKKKGVKPFMVGRMQRSTGIGNV
jgi:hypothetical protein